MPKISLQKPSGKFVIVLGVDTPIGVAVLRDLGQQEHITIGIGSHKNSIGLASRFCSHSVIREKSEDKLISQLVKLSEKFPGSHLIAISETDNITINRHRKLLNKSLILHTPKQELLDKVLNKELCLEAAKKVGIETPNTLEPNSIEEIKTIADKLKYPLVLKWSDPNAISGALNQAGLQFQKYQYAHNAEDLLKKLNPYKQINRYPLIQEYCPGKGFGQMFLVENGQITLQFQHRRIHEWPPEGGVSTLCQSVPLQMHNECRGRSIALLKELEWEGIAMVEYRFDEDKGKYYFMEVNGRFWGSLPLAISAGVPFPSALVQSSDSNETEQNYSTFNCRYMVPEAHRLIRLLFSKEKIQDPYFHYNRTTETLNFLKEFFNIKTRYYLFNMKDPGPFLTDVKNMFYKAARKLIRK